MGVQLNSHDCGPRDYWAIGLCMTYSDSDMKPSVARVFLAEMADHLVAYDMTASHRLKQAE
jgi:hypothetical protein